MELVPMAYSTVLPASFLMVTALSSISTSTNLPVTVRSAASNAPESRNRLRNANADRRYIVHLRYEQVDVHQPEILADESSATDCKSGSKAQSMKRAHFFHELSNDCILF